MTSAIFAIPGVLDFAARVCVEERRAVLELDIEAASDHSTEEVRREVEVGVRAIVEQQARGWALIRVRAGHERIAPVGPSKRAIFVCAAERQFTQQRTPTSQW